MKVKLSKIILSLAILSIILVKPIIPGIFGSIRKNLTNIKPQLVTTAPKAKKSVEHAHGIFSDILSQIDTIASKIEKSGNTVLVNEVKAAHDAAKKATKSAQDTLKKKADLEYLNTFAKDTANKLKSLFSTIEQYKATSTERNNIDKIIKDITKKVEDIIAKYPKNPEINQLKGISTSIESIKTALSTMPSNLKDKEPIFNKIKDSVKNVVKFFNSIDFNKIVTHAFEKAGKTVEAASKKLADEIREAASKATAANKTILENAAKASEKISSALKTAPAASVAPKTAGSIWDNMKNALDSAAKTVKENDSFLSSFKSGLPPGHLGGVAKRPLNPIHPK